MASKVPLISHPPCRIEVNAALWGAAPMFRDIVAQVVEDFPVCDMDWLTIDYARGAMVGGMWSWWSFDQDIITPDRFFDHSAAWGPTMSTVGPGVTIHNLCYVELGTVLISAASRIHAEIIGHNQWPDGCDRDLLSVDWVRTALTTSVAEWWIQQLPAWDPAFPDDHTAVYAVNWIDELTRPP